MEFLRERVEMESLSAMWENFSLLVPEGSKYLVQDGRVEREFFGFKYMISLLEV